MKKISIKILFATLLLIAEIFPQTFTATVDNNKIGLNDRLQVSFTFSGNDVTRLDAFQPPNFDGFMVLSGPNQSTSMQIINGAVSASKTYSYYLQPKSTGTFTIGSASIKYKDDSYKTEPIKIEVGKGSPAPQKSGQSGNSSSSVSQKEIADNLFIRATADKKNVFIGEPVIVTYKLYTRLNIASQMSISKLPQYHGFWAEELETSNNISFSTEVVNGRQFRVGLLKKVALFPSQTGQLSVTPFELTVPVMIRKKKRSGNVFDDFFNDPFFNPTETVNYNAKSNTIKVNVKQLPSKGKPADFGGAVGEFSLNSTLDHTDVKVNEPVTLKITISGKGNIKLIDNPDLEIPQGFDKYDPKVSEQINRKDDISGRKTYEYLIVPRVGGTKTIPPVKFSYFNPNTDKYITLSTDQYTVKVEGSAAESVQAAASGKEDIKMLGNDIRYIKLTTDDISKKSGILLYSFGFWAAALLPLGLLIVLVGLRKRNDKLSGNVQLLRYQRAEKVAKTRFKTAKKLMEEKNQTAFYAEISQALFGYLEDKLDIPKADFSLGKAVDELQKNNVDEGLLNNLKDSAEKCEFVRFAPKGDGIAQMNEMYDDLTKIIIELEKSFSSKKDV